MKFDRAIGVVTGLLLATVPVLSVSGQASEHIVTIDASAPSGAPQPSFYRTANATSPSGQSLGVNSKYLTLDGKPWLPVMGEFHYARVPEDLWDEEILKMKAAGVQIVSTYVFWIFQEEVEGQFDWTGRRDLRHFVELCAKHGLYVWVRIGPWDHGEVRNGGLPDWLLKKVPVRRDDPVFMRYVAKLYGHIGDQLRGLLWKDGGPVIGVQLENEYAMRGPKEGDAYILALKRLAIASGLNVPFYTVTGWDNAVVPKGEVIPVFGGYPDAPWDASLQKLGPSEVYLFRFGSRVAGNMGMIGTRAGKGPSEADESDTPFITAEMGGGIEDTYHRRPVLNSDDIAAMMPTMLGSGVNLYGTYMFQGGENPDGKLSTLEESQETGYPNDLPIKSYDFQAPLGEFGQERESFRKLKVFDYFLENFGSDLAPMSPHAPEKAPKGASDFSEIRAAIRSQGDHGFLFVNNYVRGYTMPRREHTQFRLLLPHTTLMLPSHPVDIPSGAYFIWPFHLALGPAILEYSTAQLFTRITDGNDAIWFFEQIPGIPAEFALANTPGLRVEAQNAKLKPISGSLIVSDLATGFDHPVTVHTAVGKVQLILLTVHEAENAWKVPIQGHERLLESDDQFFADSQHVFLQSVGVPWCRFSVFPRLNQVLQAENVNLTTETADGTAVYNGALPAKPVTLQLRQMNKAGKAPPVLLGPSFSWRPHGVATVPSDSADAARWEIRIPANSFENVSNLFLTVNYVGDIARLSSSGTLLEDDFYNGMPWVVGLKRFGTEVVQGPLQLSILPLRMDAPIYLDHRYWPDFAGQPQALALRNIRLVPEYQFTIKIHSD